MNTVPLHLASVASSIFGMSMIDGSTTTTTLVLIIIGFFASVAGYIKAQCTEYIRHMKAEGDRNWDRAVMLYERHYRGNTIATCHSQAPLHFC